MTLEEHRNFLAEYRITSAEYSHSLIVEDLDSAARQIDRLFINRLKVDSNNPEYQHILDLLLLTAECVDTLANRYINELYEAL